MALPIENHRSSWPSPWARKFMTLPVSEKIHDPRRERESSSSWPFLWARKFMNLPINNIFCTENKFYLIHTKCFTDINQDSTWITIHKIQEVTNKIFEILTFWESKQAHLGIEKWISEHMELEPLNQYTVTFWRSYTEKQNLLNFDRSWGNGGPKPKFFNWYIIKTIKSVYRFKI